MTGGVYKARERIHRGVLDHLLSKEVHKDKRKHVWEVLFSFERSCGALAQLGERLPCTQEVRGSIPLVSTNYINNKEWRSSSTG